MQILWNMQILWKKIGHADCSWIFIVGTLKNCKKAQNQLFLFKWFFSSCRSYRAAKELLISWLFLGYFWSLSEELEWICDGVKGNYANFISWEKNLMRILFLKVKVRIKCEYIDETMKKKKMIFSSNWFMLIVILFLCRIFEKFDKLYVLAEGQVNIWFMLSDRLIFDQNGGTHLIL